MAKEKLFEITSDVGDRFGVTAPDRIAAKKKAIDKIGKKHLRRIGIVKGITFKRKFPFKKKKRFFK